jgi:uncharacterized protein (TIGR03089 family)
MEGILPVRTVRSMAASSPSGPTFPALLGSALRTDAARPAVTFYDDATGERVELSVTTYANWVAKTASLLQDELDVERGATVLVSLPTHWLGAVWLGAAWSVGACVTDDLTRTGDADVLVCGPDAVESFAGQAGRAPVLALSLRPLGGRFAEPLPSGVTDYGAVVLGQPDAFTAYDPPEAPDVAWRDGDGELSQAEVSALDVDGLPAGGRLLTDVAPTTRNGLGTLTATVRGGGGAVWVRRPAADGWAHRAEVERTSTVLRADQPPRS